MTDFDPFERRLAAAVRSDADASVGPFDARRVADAAIADLQPGGRPVRRSSSRPARRFGRGGGMTLLAAAAAIVLVGGALAMGSGVLRQQAIVRPPAPSSGLLAIASEASPSPSSLSQPSASPISAAGPGHWIRTGSMTTPRDGSAAARLPDGRVLVAGGKGVDGSDMTSTELYDPTTGLWAATGSMIHPLAWPGPVTLLRDGRVLVADASGDIGGAELYDPDKGTWTATGMPPTGAGSFTLLPDGRVLGVGCDGAELYDPSSGTWSATGKMITSRNPGMSTVLADGRVLVTGGFRCDEVILSAEVYDPQTNSWTAAANTGFHGHPSAELEDGTLLFVGGGTPALHSPAVYDPATGTWTPTLAMARQSSGYLLATRLLDGTVLVGGGKDPRGDAGLAEVYDPTTRSWTETETMLPDFWGNVLTSPEATLLLDGTVLVTDGSGTTGFAELYVPAGVTAPALGPFPSPAPTPSPTPVPTMYPPQAGPVPQGARSWTVKVANQSTGPAILFLAESNDSGSDAGNLGRLCGSVTPNVVPAGVTEDVTFQLPPRSVADCGVKLNPVPGQAGGWMFQASELPRPGYFLFRSDDPGTNAGGWVGPGP